MTAFSTLKAKMAAMFHDLPDPSTSDTPVAALSGTHGGQECARRVLLRKVYNVQVSADADAGTDRTDAIATVGVPSSEYPNGAEVISVKLRSKAITPHASNYAEDSFSAVGSDGVVDSVVATISTDADVAVGSGGLGSGASTANKPYSALLATAAADRRIVPDGSLILTRNKVVSGVQLGECFYEIVLEAL